MIGVQILDPIALQIMLKIVNENASRPTLQMIVNISFTIHPMKNVGSILDQPVTMTSGSKTQTQRTLFQDQSAAKMVRNKNLIIFSSIYVYLIISDTS